MTQQDVGQQSATVEQYYRLKDAAKITGLSIRSLQRYIKAGDLIAKKLGTAKKSPVCIRADWLAEFMRPVNAPDPAEVAADVDDIIGSQG